MRKDELTFEELLQNVKQKSLDTYYTFPIDLSIARENILLPISGGLIQAIDETNRDLTAKCSISFDTASKPIPFYLGTKLVCPFTKLFFSNTAQAGKKLTFAVGTEEKNIFDYSFFLTTPDPVFSSVTISGLTASKMVLTDANKKLISGVTFPATTAKGSILVNQNVSTNTLTAVASTTGLKLLQNSAGTWSLVSTTGTGNVVLATAPYITNLTVNSLLKILNYPTPTSEALQLASTTDTGFGPTNILFRTYQVVSATMSSAVNTHFTYAITSGAMIMIQAFVTGIEENNASAFASYVLTAFVNNIAGTAAILGSIDKLTGENAAGASCDATIDVTGDSVRVRVTGLLNKNIVWTSTIKIYFSYTSWMAP